MIWEVEVLRDPTSDTTYVPSADSLWNELQTNIKKSTSISCIKKKLKLKDIAVPIIKI